MKPAILAILLVLASFSLLFSTSIAADEPFDYDKDVVSNVTYREVYERFISDESSLTALQKERAWKEYKGKWVQWSGIVHDVQDAWLVGRVVYVDMGTAPITGNDLCLYVTDASKDFSSQLTKGQPITFIGKLDRQPGFFSGTSLWAVTLLKPSSQGTPTSATIHKTTFTLREKSVASKDIDTHRRIWQAGMRYRQDRGRSLHSVIRSAIKTQSVLFLNPGVEVTLTGRATGLISEITLQGYDGTWWIPNQALKAANVQIPPTDVSVLHDR